MISNPHHSVLYVVDGVSETRDRFMDVAHSLGVTAETFSNAEQFLSQSDPARTGCLAADIEVPRMGAIELRERLFNGGRILPFVLVGASTNLARLSRTSYGGMLHMLERECDYEELSEAIRLSIHEVESLVARRRCAKRAQQHLATLNPTERHVLEELLQGKPNKAIARDLDLGLRTVERARARIVKKFEVHSTVEVAQQVAQLRAINDLDWLIS